MSEAPTTAPKRAPTLLLQGVGKRFGGLHAVSDVDLDVAHGERRAILGPNGAGKTTLFNVVSGDLSATSGTVELFGEDVTGVPPRKRTKRGLARTYQQSRMLLGISVEDSIYLSALGVGSGHLRPRDARARTRSCANGRARPPSARRSTTSSPSSSATSRTASTGRSRSRWRSRPSRSS